MSDDREVEGVWGLCVFVWKAHAARGLSRTYDPMRVAPLDVQKTGPALGAWSFVRFVNMATTVPVPATWEWENDSPIDELEAW